MEGADQAVDHATAPDANADERARRAASFGAAAAAYARHRPDYPIAAILWGLEPVTGTGRPIRALDLGAGTGKLTAQLANLSVETDPVGVGTGVVGPGVVGPGVVGPGVVGPGVVGPEAVTLEVVAVEPDPAMLAELRRHLPGVTAMAGRAEAIPLPEASVDAVLAGQAAHWFDLDRALPEIARVLRPGGVLAGLWNAYDSRVDWVADLHEATGHRTAVPIADTETEDDDRYSKWIERAGRELFFPAQVSKFSHSQLRTADSLIETLRTHSAFLIMEPPEREEVLAQVREYLAATPQTASGEFGLPLRTLALRAVRR